jgi:hypothetical protein
VTVSRSPLQIAAALQAAPASAVTGREHELATLALHVGARRSVFVSGAAGMGKSALVEAFRRTWQPTPGVRRIFYCGESRTRRAIAVHLLVNELLARGRLESRYIDRRMRVASLGQLRRFIVQQRLPDLSRMMHQNLDGDAACVILDHLDDAHPKVASLIEIWLERLPLVVVARDAASVGHARWLLSAFEPVPLAPLPHDAMRRLIDAWRRTNGAPPLAAADVREVLTRSAGNPGALAALLGAAERPEYRKGGAIQWRLIDLDRRIRALGIGDRPGAAAGPR